MQGVNKVYTFWYLSLYRTIIQGDAGDNIGWYWSSYVDTEVYVGCIWSLYRVILKFLQSYTEIYMGNSKIYAKLYSSLNRLIEKFVQGYTEV